MKPMIVVSAHKVGSTWLRCILRNYAGCGDIHVPEEFRQVSNIPGLIDLNMNGVTDYLKSLKNGEVIKSHCYPPEEHSGVWNNAYIFYIFRDPRDVAVSNAFYLANLSPEMGGWERLADKSIEDRIIMYLEESYHDLRLYERWLQDRNSYKISYENLLAAPQYTILNATSHEKIEFNKNKLELSIEQCTFKKMSGGRDRGEQSDASFFRKGISGDWKNYFSSNVKACFKTAQAGRWNNLLINYEYETTLDW